MAYTVKLVDVDGAPYVTGGTLVSAYPERIRWELNQPETASVTFPKTHPDAAEVQTFREVQIFKSGITAPLFWGPILNPSARGSDGPVHLGCAGPAWYLFNRHIDGIRANLLENPDFDVNLADWTATAGVTATADATKKIRGAKSAKLVQAVSGADRHLHQTVEVTAGPIGDLLTVSGWFLISAITAQAHRRRGLYIEGRDTVTGAVYATNFYALDAATFTTYGAVWLRAETTLFMPPNATWDIDVRLYAPNGTIYWDAIQLVKMQSTGTSDGTDGQVDIATLAERLVEHVQSGPKGSVNIDTDCDATGVLLARNHQWADHTPFTEALGELTGRDDGFDFGIVLTATDRTFTTYAPRKGTDRTATLTLTLGRAEDGHQIADYDYEEDGPATRTSVTVLGEGDGPDREEAVETDTTDTDGLIVEEVLAAPPKTPIASLTPIASERLAASHRPIRLLTLHTHNGATDLIDLLDVGDTFVVTIHQGWVNINHAYRAVAIELDCRNDQLAIVCNYEP